MKFERGDIVVTDGELFLIGGKRGLEHSDMISISKKAHEVTLLGAKATPYTGPIYEKDGQRFIPSGEGRAVEPGEWYLSTNNQPAKKKDDTYIHHPRVILLPVPDVEPKVDPFLEGTREITDEDLIRYAVDGKNLVVRCKNECCVQYRQSTEGEVSFRIREAGCITFTHEGNNAAFAEMRAYENTVAWQIIWMIPKEDIRVVE